MIGAIKGLAQVGRYALARKEQDRQARNRFMQTKSEQQHRLMLENLKNQMWQRRLREETLRQQKQQEFLLEKYKEDIGLKKLKEATDLERFNRLKDLEEQRIKLQEQANQIALKKANASLSKENRLNLEKKKKDIEGQIRALDVLHDNYMGRLGTFEETITDFESGEETTTKGQKWYGQEPSKLEEIRGLLNQKAYELMGQQPPPTPSKPRSPYTIDPKDRLELRQFVK